MLKIQCSWFMEKINSNYDSARFARGYEKLINQCILVTFIFDFSCRLTEANGDSPPRAAAMSSSQLPRSISNLSSSSRSTGIPKPSAGGGKGPGTAASSSSTGSDTYVVGDKVHSSKL